MFADHWKLRGHMMTDRKQQMILCKHNKVYLTVFLLLYQKKIGKKCNFRDKVEALLRLTNFTNIDLIKGYCPSFVYLEELPCSSAYDRASFTVVGT